MEGTCSARRISATATTADRPRWWPVRRRGSRAEAAATSSHSVGGQRPGAGQPRLAAAWATSGARLHEAAVRSRLGGRGCRRMASSMTLTAAARPSWCSDGASSPSRWALFVTGRGGLTATEQGQRRQFLAGSLLLLLRSATVPGTVVLGLTNFRAVAQGWVLVLLLFVLHCSFGENARVVASCEFRFSFR
ncbi:hypothetical protein EJB05_04609, partial [Eragrostis curvula]